MKARVDELLANVLRSFRGVFVVVGAFSLVMNLLLLMPTLYMLQIYDRVLPSRSEATLFVLSLVMLGAYALEAALEVIRSRVMVRAGSALDLRLGQPVFDAAFRAYLRARQGSPEQAFGDLLNLRQFLAGKGLLAFFDAPWVPIYVLAAFLLGFWLGVFALVSVVLSLILAWLNERLTAPLLTEASRLSMAASQHAGASLRNAEVIEALGMLGRLRQRWQSRQGGVLTLQARASDRAALLAGAGRFLRLSSQSGILGLGALMVLEQQLTPGGMFAASILLGRALAPVDLVMATWRGTVSARGSHARLRALLGAFPPVPRRMSLPRPAGRVVAENLTVAPPGSPRPVLKGLSFAVEPGMLVAVLGASAAGKSSLARALMGVWASQGGTLRLDEAELTQWNREELGQWLGYLPQDVELFEGTVAENIARFVEGDEGLVLEAARRAGAHEMILRLPAGYETQIGEGGVVLSAGQRQRVGLARALYGDPALIVLDEPNSSLDEAGDRALLEALKEMKQSRRTVFVITHRLNLLSQADQVMILADGKLQAFGARDVILPPWRHAGRTSRGGRTSSPGAEGA